MMARNEAIERLTAAWVQRDGEFCVGAEEFRQSLDELEEALRALGVTEEELNT